MSQHSELKRVCKYVDYRECCAHRGHREQGIKAYPQCLRKFCPVWPKIRRAKAHNTDIQQLNQPGLAGDERG
jgi:hypothetical protein